MASKLRQFIDRLRASMETPEPLQLSGEWTPEERGYASGAIHGFVRVMREPIQHPFSHPIPETSCLTEEDWTDIMRGLTLLQNGSAAEINAVWPTMRHRFGIRADIAPVPTSDTSNVERYGDM